MFTILIAFVFLKFTNASLVTWVPSASFNLPINFNEDKLPCGRQTVVFPELVTSVITLEDGSEAADLILPLDGEFLIEGVFNLGSDADNCTNDEIHYKQQSWHSWADVGVWNSDRFNKATPDSERVPCYDDVVMFPDNSPFSIILPDETQTISELRIGKQSFDENQLNDLIISDDSKDDDRRFIMNSYQQTGVKIERKRCEIAGCKCQENSLKIDCSKKYCPQPQCVYPIQPHGHCCKICGGSFLLKAKDSFDMNAFKELMEKTFNSFGQNSVEYYINRISDTVVQLVIVNNGDNSILFAATNAISSHMSSKYGSPLTSYISGPPLSKSDLGTRIVMVSFFSVVAVFLGIYFWYYKLPDLNNIPIFRTAMLSRINTRSESVVSLTRRDSAVSGFGNPLYVTKRDTVEVTETNVNSEESVE